MFILKKGHQPGVYVPLRALFLVFQRDAYGISNSEDPDQTAPLGAV